MSKKNKLKIDNQIVDVIWLDNPSINAIKDFAKDGLTIYMHKYGCFERTSIIDSTITSYDSKIDVVPGDIVLYNSNQISFFYNKSSWTYAKLGYIIIINNELHRLLNNKILQFLLYLNRLYYEINNVLEVRIWQKS